MRLIDADALKKYMRNALESVRNCYPDGGNWAEAITEEFCKDIDEQPTAQPEYYDYSDTGGHGHVHESRSHECKTR